MFNGQSISVVLGTYREKDSIRKVIDEFFATGVVDEVVVVDNNAEAGTREEVAKTKARLVVEPAQGYGHAFRRGIREATGGYIVLCEPDDTFAAEDIHRFLALTDRYPAVFGSRTNKKFLAPDAEISEARRFGNVVVAKFITLLFGGPPITDIGCTYKLFTRETIKKIEPSLRTVNPLFATELILATLKQKIDFIEIPIIFKARVGRSGIVPYWYSWVSWGLRVIKYIFVVRFGG